MHDLQKLQVHNNQTNFKLIAPNTPYETLSATATPVRLVYPTGQTGLACVQLGTKNPEYSGVLSEYPDPQVRRIRTYTRYD